MNTGHAIAGCTTQPPMTAWPALIVVTSSAIAAGGRRSGSTRAKAGCTTSDVGLPQSLAAGRHALLCFVPDANDAARTPHAFKGIVSEYTIR